MQLRRSNYLDALSLEVCNVHVVTVNNNLSKIFICLDYLAFS
jgi:hypothetical protein